MKTPTLKEKLAANQAARIALMAKAMKTQRRSEHWFALKARVEGLRLEADALIAAIAAEEGGAA